MSRITDPLQIAALSGRTLLVADLLKISLGCTDSQYTDKAACELNSGIWTDDINLTSFHRDITASVDALDGTGAISTTFTATGDILEIPNIDESLSMSIDSIEIHLAAITNNWITVAQTAELVNRPVWIWRALFDPDTSAMVGSPFLIFSGFLVGGDLDFTTVEDGTSVTLEASNQFYDFEQKSGFGCNITEHQKFYPNDTGFKYTSEVERKLEWV